MYNHLDTRLSYKKLFEDLSACNNLGQERKARILPRLRDEMQILLTCPVSSHTEAIEGILMQRFFGSSRTSIRRRYRRRTNEWSSAQPTDNAARRLIDTPELLEAVLSHLPTRDLVRSTRVSKSFRHLIFNSPILLRSLFLRPRKELFETVSLKSRKEASSGDHTEQAKDYKIAVLCPLLHNDWLSDLTIEERFRSEDYELAAIDMWAADADSFTQMYLTNPPCVEVDITLVYSGTEFGKRYCLLEDRGLDTRHYISATHKICKETGVTFALLMEALYMNGSVDITTTEIVDETRDTRTSEECDATTSDDEETFVDENELWTHSRVVEDTTLHDEIRAWERKHPGMMRLDTACTCVKLHGVIVRTAADFAALKQADRELRMEEEQRKNFQAVLLELKQKMADRAGNLHKEVEAIEDY